MSKDSIGRESGGVEQDLREAVNSEGAKRAVDQIIDSIIRGMELARQIPPESNIYDLRKAAKKEWAAIIDKETAAPELLEIMEYFDRCYTQSEHAEIHGQGVLHDGRTVRDAIRAAIAKARGE